METAQTFTGWVKHIFDAGEYSQEFVVANYATEQMKEDIKTGKKDYPKAIRLKANIKNGAAKQVESIHEGDKVVVEFYIGGAEGVSKRTGNYFAINEFNLAKQKGITILEHAPVEDSGEEAQTEPATDDDIPF